MIRPLVTSLLTCLAASTAQAAESFYARYFAPPCYARSYDAAHLAANPAQRVTGFYVTDNPSDNPDPDLSFVVAFGFTVKGSDDVYYGSASCDATAQMARCWADGDAGTFTLEGRDDGLLVRVGDHLTLEGNFSFSPDLAIGGDDKVIRLFSSPPQACGPW